jgi:WD40 repeat protein
MPKKMHTMLRKTYISQLSNVYRDPGPFQIFIEKIRVSCPNSCPSSHILRLTTQSTRFITHPPLRLEEHFSAVYSVAFSPDGARIVSGSKDKTVCIWDTITGNVIVGPMIGHTQEVNLVTFSPDGSKVASCSDDTTIRIWDSHTGAPVSQPFCGHTGWVYAIAYSPDGKKIASASVDGTIRVWDAVTGHVIFDPIEDHRHSVWSVVFSPDGALLASASSDESIHINNATTGATITSLQGHSDSVYWIAFSPDGKWIVSGSRDTTVRVWDVDSATSTGDQKCPTQLARCFQGHTHWVETVTFSSDGQEILSGSQDGTIRIWDFHTGVTICILYAPNHYASPRTPGIWSVMKSPDGDRIIAGTRNGTIYQWNST